MLDNCEHAIEACAQLAETLLRGCAHLRMLATSRQSLGLTGEVTWRVPSLTLPGSGVQVFGCSGVQGTTNDQRPTTNDDHLTTSPPEHLNTRTPEHLMQFEAVRLFVERAAAVAPGFTLTERNAAAVVQVCGRLDGIPLAIELAAARVRALRVEQIATLLDHPFRLLTGGGRTAPPRHRDWCLRLVERTAPELHGPEQAMWFERLEREHDNLRAALSGSVERGEVEAGLRLGGALPWFWMARGYVSEGQKRLAGILTLPGAEARTALRAKALHWAGVMADAQGAHVAARALLEESLTILRALDDKKSIARLLCSLGQNAQHQGDYATARAVFEECLAIQQALGDKEEIAGLLTRLGDVVGLQGDYEAARALCEESLALSRELGHKGRIAWTRHVLGRVARVQGDTARARAYLEESLALFKELGIQPAAALALHTLGDVARDQGDLTRAQSLYDESLAIDRAGGHQAIIAAPLAGLGAVAAAEGNFEEACSFYKESLTMRQAMGDKWGVAMCLEGLAGVAARQEATERAARLFAAAEALREAIGAPLEPCERADYERQVGAARAGAGELKFAGSWAEGRAMTLEAAVREAMETRD